MISESRPKEFNPKFEVASCFIEYEGKFLLLLRQHHRPQGNTWGIPTGKIEKDETPLDAMARETREETGIIIPTRDIKLFKILFVKYPEYDFIYHLFHTRLSQKHDVKIDIKEHKDFKWLTPKEALALPLIQDMDVCIKMYY